MMRLFNIKQIKGFNLIELMIIVAIIGIAVSITIPAYKDFNETSKKETIQYEGE